MKGKLIVASVVAVAAMTQATTAQGAVHSFTDFVQAVLDGQATGQYQEVKLFNDGDTYGNGTEGGGEFYLKWNNNGVWGKVKFDNGELFKTFCLEKGENFTPGSIYTVTIDDNAIWGSNVNAGPAGDPLSNKTKVLYGLYSDGLLDTAAADIGFEYGINSWANAVQYNIWNLEDSHNLTTPKGQALASWLSSLILSDFEDYLSGVKALNLWVKGKEYEYAGRKQSQAIYLPPPPLPPPPPAPPVSTPEPATLVLWSMLGSLAFAGTRLRRERKA